MTGRGTIADATRGALLAIRLRAVATTEAITATAAAMDLGVDDAETLLGRLELAGLVEHRDGRFPGWRLTDDGRAEGERLLALELDDLGARSSVTDAYQRFLALNGRLLRVCTDWQVKDANPSSIVVNDHADLAYDREVLFRLAEVHERMVPICTDLTAAVPRFAVYLPRFVLDLVAVDPRERYRFATEEIDAYHATWFELHEHLLATLGIDRATEPVPDTSR